jgi:hypothetical protein
MRRYLPLLAALAFTACASAPTAWTKPGADAAALEQDRLQCNYETSLATASMQGDWAFKSGYGAALAETCLETRGWTKQAAR